MGTLWLQKGVLYLINKQINIKRKQTKGKHMENNSNNKHGYTVGMCGAIAA